MYVPIFVINTVFDSTFDLYCQGCPTIKSISGGFFIVLRGRMPPLYLHPKYIPIFGILIVILKITSAQFQPCYMQQKDFKSLLFSHIQPILGYVNHKNASAFVVPKISVLLSHRVNIDEDMAKQAYKLQVYFMQYLNGIIINFIQRSDKYKAFGG